MDKFIRNFISAIQNCSRRRQLFRYSTCFPSRSLSLFFLGSSSNVRFQSFAGQNLPGDPASYISSISYLPQQIPQHLHPFPPASNSPQPQKSIRQHILPCRDSWKHLLHFSHTKWQWTRNHLHISYLFPIKVHIFLSRPNFQLSLSTFCRSKYADFPPVIFSGDFPPVIFPPVIFPGDFSPVIFSPGDFPLLLAFSNPVFVNPGHFHSSTLVLHKSSAILYTFRGGCWIYPPRVYPIHHEPCKLPGHLIQPQ